MSQQIQIFLSYAREDYRAVRGLYDRLQSVGFKPWMDKVDLLPGEVFAKAIPQMIRKCDFIIICLSSRSVEKRSFVQREIKRALDEWQNKKPDDLFIFPVRLDDCEVPEEINEFHWIDWFGNEQEKEWQKLLTAINRQAERLGRDVLKQPPIAFASSSTTAFKPAPVEPVGQPHIEVINGVPLELILIPAGIFTMRSDEDKSTTPPTLVSIPSFYLGKFPVTQEQWQAVMGNNPSDFKGDDFRPVEMVSWHEAQAFCERLQALTDKAYRLPSEAEWEYACRARTTGKYAGDLIKMAWFERNSEGKTHPVGEKDPNLFGLYDMHGNVWEWCEDGTSYSRALRGGCWGNPANRCGSASRYTNVPSRQSNRFGFRVAVEARTT